jgi:hypothetical protein
MVRLYLTTGEHAPIRKIGAAQYDEVSEVTVLAVSIGI